MVAIRSPSSGPHSVAVLGAVDDEKAQDQPPTNM